MATQRITVTRRDVEHLRDRLHAHIEILGDRPTVRSDVRLSAVLFGQILAIGWPVTPLEVEIEVNDNGGN